MENTKTYLKVINQEIATRQKSYDLNYWSKFLPDPDEILRNQGKDIKMYKGMLNDAHVWACVQSRKSGVLSLEWEINRGKDRDKQVETIQTVLNSLDLHSIISGILNAVLFGFQPMEIIWQKQGNLILPAEIKIKPQEWFCFDNDNKLKFRTKENYYGEDLPERKFLCPQSNPTYENPYGDRVLSRIYWAVFFKKGGIKFWASFTEKYGSPFLIGKLSTTANTTKVENLFNMLNKMVHDSVAVLPDDTRIEIIEASKSSSAEVYEKLISSLNAEISKAILGQTLTTEIGSTGSYAASNTHMSVRKDIIDSDKKLVEKTLNQLIRWIYEINFNSQDIPTFEMYEEEDVDLTLSQRDKVLCESGVKFTKEYFKKIYGFDDEDFEVAQDIKNTKPTFKEFKENGNDFPDQVAIDNFIQSFSDEQLQNQAESILRPVLQIIDDCNSYDEIYERLSDKGLNTNQIEKILQKVLFISEVWGRVNGED